MTFAAKFALILKNTINAIFGIWAELLAVSIFIAAGFLVCILSWGIFSK